jgi:sensor histidine kinase YesM
MQTIRAGKSGLALYVVAWVCVTALLDSLLAFSGAYTWLDGFWIVLPLSAVYVFVGLGAYYLCRSMPLKTTRPAWLVFTLALAASIVASLWVSLGRAWVRVLVSWGFLVDEAAGSYSSAAPIILGVGYLLFLLAVVLHYLLLTTEASREAETEALKYQLLSRDAELKTLRAQLHPHFLFNSLNSINSLIGSDAAAARRTCVLLGDLLRRSLTLGAKERIPLGDELSLAESLLSIEKVRFGERLVFQTQVDEEARACQVPPLLLQPLVENAVTHGISSLLDGGEVRIEGRLEGAVLQLSVENPRDPESPPRAGAGVGLPNVKRRLAALYGKDGRVRTSEGKDRYRVEITLPAETGNGDGS